MARPIRWLLVALLGLIALFALTGALYRPDPAPLRLSRQTVVVDGTQLSYHQRGSGPDVVLVHGGMGSAEDFEPVLDELARSHRVTAVDRPGFGLSRERGDDATYPGNARLLAGLIRALGLEHPIVVGHSHGGGVALQLAEDHPEIPGALVLLAPASYPARGAAVTDRLGALPYFGEGMMAWLGPWVAPGTIQKMLTAMVGPDTARVPPDFISYRQQLWDNPRSLAAHSRQQTTDVAGLTAIAERLPDVKIRSVLIGCAQDPTEGAGVESRRLAGELPRTNFWWLDGCGHYIQYAHPERVIEAVRLLSRNNAPPVTAPDPDPVS